jgi:hypothetical protein
MNFEAAAFFEFDNFEVVQSERAKKQSRVEFIVAVCKKQTAHNQHWPCFWKVERSERPRSWERAWEVFESRTGHSLRNRLF